MEKSEGERKHWKNVSEEKEVKRRMCRTVKLEEKMEEDQCLRGRERERDGRYQRV